MNQYLGVGCIAWLNVLILTVALISTIVPENKPSISTAEVEREALRSV
jgi:hypothetical protein